MSWKVRARWDSGGRNDRSIAQVPFEMRRDVVDMVVDCWDDQRRRYQSG